MRLNDDKLEKKRGMFGDYQLPECPGTLRNTAERLIKALNTAPAIGTYQTMTELDKRLTWLFWTEYDGLANQTTSSLGAWFIYNATSADQISRARRWLVENRYIILKTSVTEAAQESAEHYRGAIGGRRR